MSTTNSLNDDEYVTPQARDLVTTTGTIAGPGDTTKAATSYTVSNSNPVYDGGGLAWTVTYSGGYYHYVSSKGSVAQATYNSITPANILGAQSITVSAGVNLSNVVMTVTGGALSITAGATVTNSVLSTAAETGNVTIYGTVTNSYLYTAQSYIRSGGVSSNNVYLSKGQSVNCNFTGTGVYTTSTIVRSGATSRSIVTVVSGGTFDTASNYWGTSSITMNSGSYTCFLAGTMIETINGLVAIEDIQIGDQIITYQNGQKQIQPVIWTGYNTAHVMPFISDNLAGYPVRIVKNAIAEGIPSKDLLLTSEHCILLDGQFIPVRMLVNGTSISYDHSIKEYTFYHIETEEHSIISADNLLTESYLDTGNRSSFISTNNLIEITNRQKKWNIDSAAPLATTREIVEPIFTQLIQRSIDLGFKRTEANTLTTNDSGLHLLTNLGQILEATYQKNNHFVFKIPENTTQILLISRTQCPNESIGPFVDDRRRLGVLIGEVTLLEGNKTSPVTEHLTANNLQGWHDQEQTKCRWTNGHALLTIKNTPSDNIGMLIIQVLAAGPYVLENMNIQQEAV